MNFLITVNTSVLSGGGHTEDVIAVCLNTGNTAGILTLDHIFQFLWWYRMYLSVYCTVLDVDKGNLVIQIS